MDKANARRGPNRQDTDPMTKLSKSLSWVLRHGASSVGLELEEGGFLNLSDIMKMPQFSSYTIDDIQYVVDNNNKKRFALVTDPVTGELKIRANQGHSVKVDLQLKPILDSSELPVAVHGTTMRAWESIKTQGLLKMRRVHIHFAVGVPGDIGDRRDEHIISGMRGSCDVLIYLDVDKAIAGGIELYRSANNVILSPGIGDGVIPPEYFKRVVHRHTGRDLLVAEHNQVEAMSADQLADEMEQDKKRKKRKKRNKNNETYE